MEGRHITSKYPCSSMHPSKFTLVSIVIGALTGRTGQDLIVQCNTLSPQIQF